MNERMENLDPSDSNIDMQLTGYLDGELDPAEAQKVERRLGEDDRYLQRMQELQKTWDVLDVLPRAHATEAFTKSTLELMVDETSLQNRRRNRKAWTWPIRLAALAALPLLVLASTFYLSKYYQQQPVDQLVSDLPIIEKLDQYEVVDSLEFLDLLEKEGVFQNDDVYFDGVSQ
ncbi:MAG: hypothetical protein MK108_12680 [Mariniblastus sp.]|nr:hypothetical protein [Mariniblastus sp.]